MKPYLTIALVLAVITASVIRVLAGPADTYFAIDATGKITITAAGVTAINAQTANVTYTLILSASNAGGSSSGQATILAKPKPPAAPVITNGSFNLQAPVTAGQAVGTMTATNSPTSWAITNSTIASAPVVTNLAVNATSPVSSGQVIGTVSATNSPTAWSITAASPAAYAGYVAIDNTGKLTLTASGASYINALPAEEIATLTVQASNASGSGIGSVTCDPGPAP